MKHIAMAAALAASLSAAASGGPQIRIESEDNAIRKSIEDWYHRNTAGFVDKDLGTIMSLRTDDFHTQTPDGKIDSRGDMHTRTRELLGRIESWILLEFEIGPVQVAEDGVASADVQQRTVRTQRFPDGTLHEVDSRVIQREAWKRTPEGWKLCKVDRIRDQELFVDGVRQ